MILSLWVVIGIVVIRDGAIGDQQRAQLGCWTWSARNLTLEESGADTAWERPRQDRLDEDGLAWMKRRLHSEWMGCRLPGSSFGRRKEGQGDEGRSGREC
jgi:hypothetical protein